jgi:hypothetical protein
MIFFPNRFPEPEKPATNRMPMGCWLYCPLQQRPINAFASAYPAMLFCANFSDA